MIKAVKILNDLQNLFFPITCLGCSEIIEPSSASICVECRHQLPLTQFINTNANPTEKILYGRVKIENAGSFLRYYKKGIVRELIHNLKYRGHQELGTLFGKWIGVEILNSERFKNIDYVIPVPLHKKKKKERGYNQVAKFGKEIADQIAANYSEEILYNIKFSKTHTRKNRSERVSDLKNRFLYNDNINLKGKHILLVDDVITTGATMESCIIAFPKDQNIKFSIITIAITT